MRQIKYRRMPITITIPLSACKVLIANKARPIYYKASDKIPKKYKNFFYDIEGYILTPDLKRVIKNHKTANKPRYWVPNMQDLYSGKVSGKRRAVYMNKLKDNLRPYVEHLPTLSALNLQLKVSLPLSLAKMDISNYWIYIKCFEDLLVEEGKLPNDNKLYVTKAGPIWYDFNDSNTLTFYLYE